MKWLARLACMTLCISVLLMVSACAVAGDCDIYLSESRIDLGRIARPGSHVMAGSLGLYALGQRSVQLTATCPSAGQLGLFMRGERNGGGFRFANQGSVLLVVRNALLDGRSVQLSTLAAGTYGTTIEAGYGDTVIPLINGLPASGKVWSMTLDVRPTIPMSELRTADAQTPRADITFEVRRR